jgi:hypothetical protein
MQHTHWDQIACHDVQKAFDAIQKDSIFYTYPEIREQCDHNFLKASSLAMQAKSKEDYFKALQKLINNLAISQLFFITEDMYEITSSGYKPKTVPLPLTVAFEKDSVTLRISHFDLNRKEEWENFAYDLAKVKEKKHIVLDLRGNLGGSILGMMHCMESLFGKSFWDGLYLKKTEKRVNLFKNSQANCELLKENAKKTQGFQALSDYYLTATQRMEKTADAIVKVQAPHWQAPQEQEESSLGGKRFTLLINETMSFLSLDVAFCLNGLANVDIVGKVKSEEKIFCERRKIQLKSSSFNFPIKEVIQPQDP